MIRQNRLPTLQQIIPVYAIIVMMIYGWTVYRYIWEVSGWIYYLSLTDILSIYTYALSVNFVESFIVLLPILVVSVILPQKWFGEAFTARGSALAMLSLGYLMYFSASFKSISEKDYPQDLINWLPLFLAATFSLVFAAGRMPFLRRAMDDISSRAVIFLYILIPASLLSILYVVIRNLFEGYLHG